MVVVVGLVFLLEILSVVFCLNYLYGRKPCFDVMTVCLVVLEITWMYIARLLQLDNVWSLVMYPIVMLYCGFEFGFKLKSIIINNILYIAIVSILQATAMIIWYEMLGIKEAEAAGNLFVSIFTFFVVAVGLRKCKLNVLSEVLQRNEKLILVSLIVVGMSISLFLINYKQNNVFTILYYVILGVSVFLIIMVTVDIGKHRIKAKEAEAELRLHKLYEESFRNLIDEISARQHEFDNHINTIYSQHFLYKTYDELVEAQKKYCVEVVKENRFNKLLKKGNPVILCFLYSKFTEAEKEGIRVNYRINIGNLECQIPVYKMVELLGNLIKNAVEAAKERENGSIYVMMQEESDKICIEVSNESEVVNYQRMQEFFRKGYSEKGKNRGYGLYNVKRICEEYGIEILCENREENGRNRLVFSLIALKKTDKQRHS